MSKIPRIKLPATLEEVRVSRPEFSGQKSNARKLASKKTKSPNRDAVGASGDSPPAECRGSSPGGGAQASPRSAPLSSPKLGASMVVSSVPLVGWSPGGGTRWLGQTVRVIGVDPSGAVLVACELGRAYLSPEHLTATGERAGPSSGGGGIRKGGVKPRSNVPKGDPRQVTLDEVIAAYQANLEDESAVDDECMSDAERWVRPYGSVI